MRLVTEITEVNKKRSRVFLDEEFAFVLYKGELGHYGIEVGAELSEEAYAEIMADLVIRRAKLRALHILEAGDRSELELRDKLKRDYPEAAVDTAVEYVKSYRYVDDEEYARRFVESNKSKKSARMLSIQLEQKGIDRELAQELLEEAGDCEEEQIGKLLRQKVKPGESLDPAKKQKVIASLMRKGYPYEKIRRVLADVCESEE